MSFKPQNSSSNSNIINSNPLPYSILPNTRPRISSPLISELTFNPHHPDLFELINQNQNHSSSSFANNTLLIVSFLIDSITFIHLARIALPHLRLHLHAILPFTPSTAQELVQNIINLPTHLILPTVVLIKSISGICLLNTGTTWISYSARNALVYTTLTLFLSFSTSTRITSVSLLFFLCIIATILVCLPLLRLVQLLLDLEDQQSINDRHRQINQSHRSFQTRKNFHSHRNSNLLQARYQHLMNPF